MVAGMFEIAPGLRVGGVPAREQLASLSEDEALGAVVGDYRDWDYIVNLCTTVFDTTPQTKPLSRHRLIRWLIKHDLVPGLNWGWHVQGPNGQCCSSSAITRAQGVRLAKRCIDNYIRDGKF